MALYARVRLGPITWVERLDGDRPSSLEHESPSVIEARRRVANTRAPRWTWLIIAGIVAGALVLCSLPMVLR